MKRLALSISMIAALAIVGVGLAHGNSHGSSNSHSSVAQNNADHGRPTSTLPNTDTPGANHGNQVCYLIATDTYYATPGLMFQAMRQTPDGNGQIGDNPVQWLESFPSFTGTVGDFVHRNCQTFN